MFDGMEDADLIKMARGEVPPHMRAQLLQVMHGRVKKYAEGGLVKPDFSWITPQVAAQLLNRTPGTELPPGITDDTLRQILTKGNTKPVREPKAQAPEDGERYLSPIQRAQKQRGDEVTTNIRERLPSVEYDPGMAASPATRQSPIAKAAEAADPKSPANMKPESVLDRASRQTPADTAATADKRMPARPVTPTPAPKPPQSRLAQAARAQQPRASAPEPEQAFRLPTMRPDGEAEQAPTPKPEQPSTLARAAAEPGKKEPPTWASPLMAAGFAMLASRSPNFGNALGEAGLAFMSQSQQEEAQRRRALREATQDSREERKLGQDERRLGIEDKRAMTEEEYKRALLELQNRQLDVDAPLRGAQTDYYKAQAAHAGQARQVGQQQAQLMALAERAANGDATAARQLELLGKRDSGDMLTGLQKAQIEMIKSDPMMPAEQKMQLLQRIVGGGGMPAAPNPIGMPGMGGISQGGKLPDPAGLR